MSDTSINVIKSLLALVILDLLKSNTRKVNVLHQYGTSGTSGTVPPVLFVPAVHILDKDSCVPVVPLVLLVHVLDQSTTAGRKGGRPGRE